MYLRIHAYYIHLASYMYHERRDQCMFYASNSDPYEMALALVVEICY